LEVVGGACLTPVILVIVVMWHSTSPFLSRDVRRDPTERIGCSQAKIQRVATEEQPWSEETEKKKKLKWQ
jgi:hypothetical protein